MSKQKIKDIITYIFMIIIIIFLVMLAKETVLSDSENESFKYSNNIHFIKIENGLVYDENTYIVYLWEINSSKMPSAYFGPNGLPYKYDVDKLVKETRL